MKSKDENHYILSTGKEIYAFGGILGVDEKLSTIYYGYDGEVFREWYDDDISPDLTPEERVEICEFMLERWRAYLHKAQEAPHAQP